MENFIFLDPENHGHGGNMMEERLPNKPSFGSVVRKRLSDITNSQTHLKSPNNQDETPRPVSIATKEYIEQLQKENMNLRQLLHDRGKLLELTGLELAKMRINIQKLQQQNRVLAQANTQMTMERNLDKDRLKVTQHELACSRGALLALKDIGLKNNLKVKGKAVENGDADNRPCKVNRRRQSSRFQSPGDSAMEEQVEHKEKADDKREEVEGEPVPALGCYTKPCNLNRSRQSRSQSLGSSAMKEQVRADEVPDGKRLCLRRQSARSKSVKVEPTEDLFEIEDARFPTSSLLEDNIQDCTLEEVEAKEQDDNESEEPKREHVPAHGSDDKQCKLNRTRRSRTQSLGSSVVNEQVTSKEKPDDKRQSAHIKEQREPSDEKSENKRPCLQRQSTRYKSTVIEPSEVLSNKEPSEVLSNKEPSEDLFEIEDQKFPTSTLLDENMQDSSTSATTQEVKELMNDRNSDTTVLRTSIGRPMRRAAVKVQSYKEVPVNVKMRRAE